MPHAAPVQLEPLRVQVTPPVALLVAETASGSPVPTVVPLAGVIVTEIGVA